jgi:hypothetical protein
MSLGERQQGEITYLRAALGVDELFDRVAKLEGDEEARQLSLEERHSAGLAGMAKLPAYGSPEYLPEHLSEGYGVNEDGEAEKVQMQGEPDQTEVISEPHPATVVNETPEEADRRLAEEQQAEVSDGEVDLSEYMDEVNYSDWTVESLKSELSKRDLPTSGNKAELIARLESDDKKA